MGVTIGYISSPFQSPPGALVQIQVPLTPDKAAYVSVTGDAPVPVTVSPDYQMAEPGKPATFVLSLTMPTQDIILWIYTWMWDGQKWVQQGDYQLVSIAVTTQLAVKYQFASAVFA